MEPADCCRHPRLQGAHPRHLQKLCHIENVVKELALASEGRKRILPVFIEEADIPETMAYQLAGIQRVEFFEGNEEAGLKAVIRALSTLDVDVCSDATAAAGAEAGHGVRRHHHNKSEAKREISIWLKVATGVVALAVLSLAGTIFMDGRRPRLDRSRLAKRKPIRPNKPSPWPSRWRWTRTGWSSCHLR